MPHPEPKACSSDAMRPWWCATHNRSWPAGTVCPARAAPRAEGLDVTIRGNLAQALLATEMIDRLLDYAKTGEDRQQVAWSWANRIGDWLDDRLTNDVD